MSLDVNVHLHDPLVASAKTFTDFVALSVRAGSDGEVTYFFKSIEDALTLHNAVAELVKQMVDLNTAKIAAEAVDSLTL